MIDCARPLIVTISTTRISGRAPPPEIRKRVRSGERAGSSKVSSKPLCVPPEPSSTLACTSASETSRGGATGTGPILSESWTPLCSAMATAPSAPGCGRRAPSVSVSSNGSVTALASAICHQSSGSPKTAAASRSGRSPACTMCSNAVGVSAGRGGKRRSR